MSPKCVKGFLKDPTFNFSTITCVVKCIIYFLSHFYIENSTFILSMGRRNLDDKIFKAFSSFKWLIIVHNAWTPFSMTTSSMPFSCTNLEIICSNLSMCINQICLYIDR